MKTTPVTTSENATLTLSSPLLKTIIESIKEKKGEGIVSLDLKNVHESVADFFIFCEATNIIQLNTIIDYTEEQVRIECEQKPYRVDGKKGDHWIVLDYVDVVIHCMMPETRKFYNLEELWHDANKKEH